MQKFVKLKTFVTSHKLKFLILSLLYFHYEYFNDNIKKKSSDFLSMLLFITLIKKRGKK
ncbi:hypothetical protein GLOIN_2v1545912 [Rhizophagus irregularis DAOM 181602=DAOM 197198]|uniref:Uncharacterized protein n=1 Tax=Rhizophagus irregularis (strain DAOM 181602 / DAOM 197198 / MUCL 43194) TaxID=747089 RepID=A0A2P4QIZ1_RHIID|nr:hypothetical protein GLOIN_2v1545912 [Rhizophagus irregularis DAOM 181602=DAOM 197198]POG77593.1 hypothetical protein GLOIN_2v1545912 [Rhizophagus irregularis DAOM 181602=DAOM 197198]|eukprot:XP_025184459.1 hypothetical protein GLOIN_2v1545912 [Rhizophagus irregularis DAOM 181602=DAOM 197198]